MSLPTWTITHEGASPLLAVALHDGHLMREDTLKHIALSDTERLREEDPFTGGWTEVAETRVVVHRSRFECDLNRPRDRAVYVVPADAWGLNVWQSPLNADLVAESVALHDAFYADVRALLDDLSERGPFIVYDIHSYNHRRDGRRALPADPVANPEVNIGTGTMLDRTRWAAVISRFMSDLRGFDYLGRQLDVRENVKFMGGYFARWVHATYPETGCVLSIEFKKFFMDEWTGEPDPAQIDAIRRGLASTVPGVLEIIAAG